VSLSTRFSSQSNTNNIVPFITNKIAVMSYFKRPTVLDTLQSFNNLAAILHQNKPLEFFWTALSDALLATFSHTSCTVLSYDTATRSLCRLYSSRPDVHRLGGRKRVTDSLWSQTVLERGQILIGSNRADIKSYFSEYEILWANGWESILNIPVRFNGRTIGTINIMNQAGAYAEVDEKIAILFAQLSVSAIQRATETANTEKTDQQDLEYV
jgi:GAF domain-containing protein